MVTQGTTSETPCKGIYHGLRGPWGLTGVLSVMLLPYWDTGSKQGLGFYTSTAPRQLGLYKQRKEGGLSKFLAL